MPDYVCLLQNELCKQPKSLFIISVRTCSKSFEQQSQESQTYELQAGIELAFAVLPQPPILLQPGKTAFYHPAFRHHLKLTQLAAFGYLYFHFPAQHGHHPLGKRLARIAAVGRITPPSLPPGFSCSLAASAKRRCGRWHPLSSLLLRAAVLGYLPRYAA